MKPEDVEVGMVIRVTKDSAYWGEIGTVRKGGYLPWVLVQLTPGHSTALLREIEPISAIDRLGQIPQ